jgi:hypothetical protein
MNVGYERGADRVFIIWPIVVYHEIDENSPLYELNKDDLQRMSIEIVAILEGTMQATSAVVHVSIVKFHLFYGLRKNRLIIQRIKAHRTVL